MKTKYIECECQSMEHTVRFAWNSGNPNDPWDGEEMYLDIWLNDYLPWYKKIVVAVRYLFGKQTFRPYDCVIISKDKVIELRDWMKEITRENK